MATPANIHHREAVNAEPVILAEVAAETVIRNAVAVVTAALLPGAVLRLPAMCTITLPGNLLLVYLRRAPLSCRPIAPLLTLLALLILLPLGLLLLFGGVVLLMALSVLSPFGLLLLFRGVVLLLTLLALLILLPTGLRLVLSCGLGRLFLLSSRLGLLLLLLLVFRFILWLLV
jgi:hypothetical protein